MNVKNKIDKNIIFKISFALIWIIGIFLLISTGSNKIYALNNNTVPEQASLFSSAKADKEGAEVGSIISVKTILEIADKNIEEEKRIQKHKVLLLKQPLDLKVQANNGHFVVSYDNEIAILNGEIAYGTKAGEYKLTVFCANLGLIDYTLEIRDIEPQSNIQLKITEGTDFKLDVKNPDLATYVSSNENIITVSPDGIIKSQNAGKAVVTATINDYQEVKYCIDSRPVFDFYNNDELQLIYAIVQQECATSYEGALAVISCAYNRSITPTFACFGKDPLSQLRGKNQFCYSLDNKWQKYLSDGSIHSYVKQAVYDCLILGKTNHDFLSFRGFKIEDAVNFDGNYYFNYMNN